MRKYLIPAEGRFYKANLHSHSNVSDGLFTPAEMKEYYKSQGYSIIAYTDHDVMVPHHELSDESFLALTGFEAEFNENGVCLNREDKTCHICFIAPTPDTVVQPCWNSKYAIIGNAQNYVTSVVTDEMKLRLSVSTTPIL